MSTEMAVLFLEATTQSRDADGRPNQFDTTAMSGLRDVKVTSGHVTALLDVTQEVSNRYGTLHGGCIATLVDTVGSAALISLSPKGGVSLNINVNYLSKVATGGTVRIEAQVVKVGKTIATIEVHLRDDATGVLVAQGTHVKFIAENEPTMAALIQQQLAQQQQQQRGEQQEPQALMTTLRSKL